MSDLANQSIAFEVEGLAKNTLVVTKLAGTEAISDLWSFDLELVSRDKALDLEQVLYSPVRLGLKQGLIVGGEKAVRTRWFAGVLSEFHQHEAGQGWVTYRARMVPKLWLTTRFFCSRILLDKDLDGLIKDVLAGGAKLTSGEDFTVDLKQGGGGGKDADVYPEREFIVQYEESDFDFVSRWLEREGVFYFFDNEGEKEEVLFTDSTAAYRDSRETLPYRPSTSSGSQEGGENTLYEEEVVGTFAATANRVLKDVILKDYNWRTPEVELSVKREVKSDGVGTQIEYNDHFKTEEQGKQLALVRSEERTSRKAIYRATTNCKALRPGKTFKLTEHYRSDFNTTYLVTEVSHVAEQTVDLDGGKVASGSYSNSLTLIPAEVLFRPERRTPWPSIKGVMHAKIDAPETDGEFAEVDDYGRYRVVFPYDASVDKNNPEKRQGGPAARWVRMIQPYAGRESGMHFPLLKGTDVLVTHLDGDPDRPVITGAVPNPDTMSPVTSANYMSNRIVTTSGNTMIFDDNPECPGIMFKDATGSEIEDNRFPVTSGGGGGSGGDSPSGGSGGVIPPKGQRARPELRPRRSKPAQPQAGGGGAPPRPPQPAEQPSAGVGATLPDPNPFTEESAWDAFVSGAAFQQCADNGAMIAGSTLNESNLKKAVNQLLRKHLTEGSSPAGAASMGELMAGFGNEMADMIATPFGLGSPDSGAVDGYLSSLASGGKQKYSTASETFQVFIGDNAKVFIGNAKYTFDDVSNSVSFGTGGYSYSRTDGDSFSESYQYGADCGVSIYYGAKESFSLSLADTKSTSIEMSMSESHSITMGTKISTDTFLGGETSTKFELALKNSNSLWAAAIMEIDIYASAKFTLELSASALLEIKIVAAKEKKIKIPGEDKITIDDLVLRINKNENNLNLTKSCLVKLNNDLTATENALSDTKNALAETENKLAQTETKLAETETKLTETQTALADTQTKLSESTTALSKEQKTLSNSQTSAITTIQ